MYGGRTVPIASGDIPTDADILAIIRFDFATNIDACPRGRSKAPRRTQDEIFEKHLVPALQPTFRRDIASNDLDEYRANVAKREARLP